MLTLNWNIIWTFVDLIVLYVLMKKFLFARVQKVLDQRQEMIQGQMDHAKEQEALANQTEQILEQIQQVLFTGRVRRRHMVTVGDITIILTHLHRFTLLWDLTM